MIRRVPPTPNPGSTGGLGRAETSNSPRQPEVTHRARSVVPQLRFSMHGLVLSVRASRTWELGGMAHSARRASFDSQVIRDGVGVTG